MQPNKEKMPLYNDENDRLQQNKTLLAEDNRFDEPETDVEKLAREVWKLLKTNLRIENERVAKK